MRFIRFVLAIVAVLSLSFGAGFACAEEGHDHAQGGTLELNNGNKWPTDEALRQGMGRINAAFGTAFPAIMAGKAPAQGYAALAKQIQTEIAQIVQSCKLDKQADAMLHRVLADLIEGAEVMEGKKAGVKPRDGAMKVAQALENYGNYFDHPGWGNE